MHSTHSELFLECAGLIVQLGLSRVQLGILLLLVLEVRLLSWLMAAWLRHL